MPLPRIEITHTELVWPGKYDEDGNLVPPRRVSLPFQVIAPFLQPVIQALSEGQPFDLLWSPGGPWI